MGNYVSNYQIRKKLEAKMMAQSSDGVLFEGEDVISPYKTRKILVNEIKECSERNELHKALTYVEKLRQAIGIESESGDEDNSQQMCFTLDDYGVSQVLKLNKLLLETPGGWEERVETVCHQLLVYYGRPCQVGPQQRPQRQTHGLLDLNLMGVDVSRKQSRIDTILEIVVNNRDLRSVELAFTGIDDKTLCVLLPELAQLESLAYLGLRGNKLHSTTVEYLTQLMKNEDNFAGLLWVDLQNNKDIHVLPDEYLQLLKLRWPDGGCRPSLRQLADDNHVSAVADNLPMVSS